MILAVLTIIVIVAAAILIFQNRSKSKTPLPTVSQEQPIGNVPPLTVVAKNLEVPWALAFLPTGELLVTERQGRVQKIDKEGNKTLVGNIEDVKQIGEGGLHGIAVHPNFQRNNFLYVYYTYEGDSNKTLNRVVRFVFDGKNLSGKTIILDAIPGAQNHDGGRIRFGPDGFLYVTTGDAQNPSLSQDVNSLAGKILRVTDDGKAEVYSYGHRNPQGIAWDNQGRLWATEHGSSATDEVNLIEPGKNYGWPEIRGDQTRENMVSPIVQSGKDTWAPAGAAFLNDSLFFGGLRGQALFELKIETRELKEHFKGEFGRIRDVVLGPDDMLYITTSNRDGRGLPSSDDDRIIRVNPNSL